MTLQYCEFVRLRLRNGMKAACLYMPHGTLHDHLHSGLSSLNWSLRLKILMRAAKGLEYLHKEAEQPIVYHNVKTSNFLLDSAWGARIADFGLLSANEKDLGGDMKRCIQFWNCTARDS